MTNNDIYFHPKLIIDKKIPSYLKYWFILHIILFLLLGLLCTFYPIEKKLEFNGYYQNGQVRTVVDQTFFTITTKELMIQDQKYFYQVQKIEPLAYEEGDVMLWEVTISLKLPDQWKIENNQLHLFFLQEKTTISKQVIKKIKKGMKL